MVSNELRQRRGIAVRTYILTDAAVVVHHRGVLRHSESTIPYHSLSDERYSTTTYSKPWLGVTIGGLFFALMMVLARSQGDDVGFAAEWFYFGIAALAGAAFLQSWNRYTGFVGIGTSIDFWVGKPTTEELERFLGELLRRRAAYLARLHASTPASLAQELERLVALRDRGVLSPSEFDKLKARIVDPNDTDRPSNGAA